MSEEKRPPRARVFEVRSTQDLLDLLKAIGLDPTRPRATDLSTDGFIQLQGGPTLPTETAIAGALTALHQCAHDLLVAGGVMPSHKEVGELTAKLLARGLKEYVENGPPCQEERDAFNEEWEEQANRIAPPDPQCPCPRCRKARGE